MADTTFVAQTTQVVRAWLQAVNNFIYRGTNPTYAATTGAANVYTLTLSSSLITALSDGMSFTVKPHQTNAGASTFNVVTASGTLSGAIQLNGSALTGGEIIQSIPTTFVYTGSAFQMPASYPPAAVGANEWQMYTGTPTYIGATQFRVSGDQTATFTVGRRLKTTITAGTGYHTITASSYGAPNTTITVNGTSLDSGLSAVSYGLLASNNSSIPAVTLSSGDWTFQNHVTFSESILGATPLSFEGATDNGFEQALAVTDPTSDETATLANATFTFNAVGAGVKDLIGTAAGGAGTIAFSARQYAFRNAAGVVRVVNDNAATTFTINTGTAGPAADGRDQAGALTNGSECHCYAIYNGSAVHGLVSPTAPNSFTGSTLPTGYTWWVYLGSYVLASGGVNFQATDQQEDKVTLTALPALVTGGTTAASEVSVATTVTDDYVPATATYIGILIDYTWACSSAGSSRVRVGHRTGVYSVYAADGTSASSGGASGNGEIPNRSRGVYWIADLIAGSWTNRSVNVYAPYYRVPN